MSAIRLFGTDGIRDIAGRGNLSPEQIVRTGKVIGYLLHNEPQLFWSHSEPKENPDARVVLIRDTRASGYMIEGALRAGLLSSGANIVAADILPTPVCSFLVKALNCSCGIVISASHNPNEYNGIKFFNAEGYKISTSLEDRIEELISNRETIDSFAADQLGSVEGRRDAAELYIDNTVNRIIDSLDLRGMKVVLDCANGAVTEVAPAIFNNLGADTYCINAEPDGCNINENSGALHPDSTAQTVKRLRAAIGFSFDGDGDRVILVDEKGIERDGDYVMAICGRYLKEKNLLAATTVVTTTMANLGLELSLKESEIEMVRTKVGDRYVTEELLRRGAILGGEQSGHILFLDNAPTGDGVWTALMILKIINDTGKTLSELSSCMDKYPQILLNVTVKTKPDLDSIPEVKKAVDDAMEQLGDEGRVVLRYSGTEPVARVMLEGPDFNRIKKMAEKIANVIENSLD
jgi:phosphoglucosamine mutase